MKNIFLIMVCFIFLLIFTGVTVSASDFAGGSGTEDDPYWISSVDQLQNVDSYPNSHFILVNNIDASETSSWNGGEGFNPINDFTGKFDGQGYSINNLYIDRTDQYYDDYVGLFGVVDDPDAEIANVHLADVDITGNYIVGSLIGYMNNGDVWSCSASGTITASGADKEIYGGLVGQMTGSGYPDLENCYSTVDISGGSEAGGLVGRISCNYMRVLNCYAAGQVTGSGGGLIGNNIYLGDDLQSIENCFWDNQTSGKTNSDGGTGKNTDDMQNIRTFTDTSWSTGLNETWDFYPDVYDDSAGKNTWMNTSGYPQLTSFVETPSSLSATALNDSQIGLTWTKGINQVYTVIERASDSTPLYYWDRGEGTQIYNGTDTSFTDTGLNEGTEYHYRAWSYYPSYTKYSQYDVFQLPSDYASTSTTGDPNVYYISNVTEFEAIADHPTAYFVLTEDIDFADKYDEDSSWSDWNGGDGWSPISEFTGVLNGYGHTVSNFFSQSTSDQYGSFVTVFKGTILNIGFTDLEILGGSDNYIGLVQYAQSDGFFYNMFIEGTVSGYDKVGGFAGETTENVKFERCFFDGQVTGHNYNGGFAGIHRGSMGNCYTRGKITGNDGTGGLVGQFSDDYTYGYINTSYATAEIDGGLDKGAILGTYVNGEVNDCFYDNQTVVYEGSNGTGKNTEAMKNERTFTDTSWSTGLTEAWDFYGDPFDDTKETDIWQIDGSETINDGYPFFSWGEGLVPEAPSNLTIDAADYDYVNLSWEKGDNADTTVLVRKEGEPPTSPSDGTIVYNDDGTWCNDSIDGFKVLYYVAWSWSADAGYSYDYAWISTQGVVLRVYNASNETLIDGWDLFISNQEGTETYNQSNCSSPLVLLNDSVPYGNQTMIEITKENFRPGLFYFDFEEGGVIILDIYLLPSNLSSLYTFIVKNDYEARLDNVNIKVKRRVGGEYKHISSKFTAQNGEAEFFLIPFNQYKVILTKEGYETEIDDYTPTTTKYEKTFYMHHSLPDYDPEYMWNNITWNIDPDEEIHRTNISFYFNITSDDDMLDWYRMRIQYYNTSIGDWQTLYDGNQSEAGGGSLNFISNNTTGRYQLDAWFKKDGFAQHQFHRTYIITQEGLSPSLEDVPDSILFLVIISLAIAAIAMLIGMGAGEMSGLAGLTVMGIGGLLAPGLMIGSMAFWQVVLVAGIAYFAILFLIGRF